MNKTHDNETHLTRPVGQHHSPEQCLGAVMTWHVLGAENGGAFSFGEALLRPGDEPPLHIHAREDETWYILEGSMLFQLGLQRTLCKAGEAILLPRGLQHGFAVQTPSARILHIYSPGGIEDAFQSLSAPLAGPPVEAPPAEIESVFARRGVTFVGPPLPVLLAAEQDA